MLNIREKTVKRNIRHSKNCRVNYGNCSEFDVLIVEINDGKRIRKYSINAKYLSPHKDSIRFYPETNNGVVIIKWNHEIENYINEVQ